MRLQKYIAKCGVTSRRKAEELISLGRVEVNGQLVREMGTKVDISRDLVKVDGKLIELDEKKRYILLNKPVGYVTTLDDELGRKTVVDLIKIEERIFPVGRLDRDTEGLLILTNDGDLTHKLTHPSFEIEKTYLAKVEGVPKEEELEEFRRGLIIEGKKTWPAKINLVEKNIGYSILKIRIHEGRNRQVRKMCAEINHPVKELKRIEFGGLKLTGLGLGEYRDLNEQEINRLKKL